MKHHETLFIRCDDIGARCGDVCVWARCGHAETLSLDAETSALGAKIAQSYRGYRRGVSGNIGDCGVGITPQMCNRVSNQGDMSTFSKPV